MCCALRKRKQSTRGASKQRRDQINVEIQCLRDLLPLSDSVKDRLFQLQVMSLACIFIRKQRYLPHLMRPYGDPLRPTLDVHLKAFDSCKAMKGFLMMLTRSGKMLYISENASEYLGHSVEEIMCQGDSVYDLVDIRDQGAVRAELLSGPVPPGAPFPEQRVFICRMNLSRTAKRQLQYHKFVLIQGRYVQPTDYFPGGLNGPGPSSSLQPVFAAFCQPLLNPENAESLSNGNTTVFTSQHFMDMRFKDMDSTCAHHLGYTRGDLAETSWYSLLHPNHLEEVSYKHRLLCQEKEGSVLCLLRLQAANGDWLWMHTVLAVRGNFLHEVQDGRRVRHVITATYQLLNELEAATLQANSWIYSIRHSFPSTFQCKDAESPDSGERPFTPASPFPPESSFVKSEPQPPTPVFPTPAPLAPQPPLPILPPSFPFHLPGEQIKVEIPSKLSSCVFGGGASLTLNSLFDTPDHSSPESSTSSFPFGVLPSAGSSSSSTSSAANRLLLDGMSELLHAEIAAKETLPELRDELDDFFKQVEVEYPLLSDSFSSPSLGSSSSPPFGASSSSSDQAPTFGGMGCMLGSPVAPVSKPVAQPSRHSPTEAPDIMKLLHSRFGTPNQPLLPSLQSLNNNNNNCWDFTSQPRPPWGLARHHSMQCPETDTFPSLHDPFQSRKRLGSWAGV